MRSNPRETGLFTDLYQLTMAQAYWRSSRSAEATFSLFFRSYPRDRGYFVFSGLSESLGLLERFGFSREDVEFLGTLELFDPRFLEYLRGVRFTGRVRAMDEGAIFFAGEPVLEVTAPMIEGQILETALLNAVSAPSLLATKASRIVHAAGNRAVVDFAARRTHHPGIAAGLARDSYMVGFAGTSNLSAASEHGLPAYGTMAHSFVTSFDSEIDAFRAYVQAFPDSSTLLVDTYDTIEGTRRAMEVALEMRRRGQALGAIRLDSGDLLALSRECRALLDSSGLDDVRIFASGGLDEFEIDRLLSEGAPIDGFGVGTRLGVSADAPAVDSVYKLTQYDGRPVLKLSPGKQTLPGRKQVFRYSDAQGTLLRDVIALADEPAPEDGPQALLREVMVGVERTAPQSSLEDRRQRFGREFDRLDDEYKALRSPKRYDVGCSGALAALVASLTERASKDSQPGTRR